jgi:catechol 2,3-dioxygenase-like lactoylglutathione lyase family enzyme
MKTGKTPARKEVQEKELITAYPQLFVTDMNRAAHYYEQKLGFKLVSLYGDPPFYGQVGRDGARLNLRVVDNLPFNQIERAAEQLLSAYIPVSNVKAWFLEFTERGANFLQTLKS